MIIKIQKTKLINALNISSKAISPNASLPILSGLLLEAFDSNLKITGNDLNLGIETNIEVSVFEEGSVVVEANLFKTIINKFPEDIITIEYKENMVYINCNEIKFNLVGFSSNEYPEIPIIKKENTYNIEPQILKTMIKETIFAVSTDEARPILTGVLFKIENSNLTLVALDGYRLAYKKVKLDKMVENEAVIPSKTLKEVNSVLGENSNLEISFSDKHILFTIDNIKIISRLLEGDFIKYNQIIPDQFKSELCINKNDFKNAIERALLLSIKNKNSSIKLTINKNNMLIQSNSETGKMKENIKTKYTGEELIIGFNPTYILDVLKIVDSDEVIMKFNNNMSPSILKRKDDENYKYMVLPVRLS